jgi:hypothetical protein
MIVSWGIDHAESNIPMRVTVAVAGLFIASFLVHLVVWRIRVPRRQSATLLLIFLGLPLVVFGLLLLLAPLRNFGSWSFWTYAHIAICQISAALGYTVFYSVFEATSPTLRALLYVTNAGSTGRTSAELVAMIKGATSMQIKLKAMIRDQMLFQSADYYFLTPKGRLWAITFGIGRRCLGLAKGG